MRTKYKGTKNSVSKKKYVNPYFKKRKTPKISAPSIPLKGKIVIAGILIGFCGIFWLLFFAPWMQIKHIEVVGSDQAKSEEIKALAWQQTDYNRYIFLSQKNLFVFSKQDFLNTLNSRYVLKNIKVNKKFLNTILITFEKRDYALLWSEAGKIYFADNEGNIISDASMEDVKKGNILLIENQSPTNINNGVVPIDSKTINFVLNLYSELKDAKYNFKVEKYIVDSEMSTIKAQVSGGPQIFFNTTGDMNAQINKLLIVKNDKMKSDFNKKIYIDLRFGDKVYYK